MSQPGYQVQPQIYNFDKSKLTKNTRPKIYGDVASANSAAYDWLQILHIGGEVVQVLRIKEEAMRLQAMVDVSNRTDISSWTEVFRVGEETDGMKEGASCIEKVDK